MAVGRKIQFQTEVRAIREVSAEESTVNKRLMQDGIKRLGGKGVITINATQRDDWISTRGDTTNWEDLDDNWNTMNTSFDGALTVPANWGGSGMQLFPGDSSNLGFCFIKNTGSNSLYLSVGGDSSTTKYNLVVGAGGSLCFRGDGNPGIDKDDIYIRSVSGTSMEYLIAGEV